MRFRVVLLDGYQTNLMTLRRAQERAQVEVYANRQLATNGVRIDRQDGKMVARYFWDSIGGLHHIEY